MTNTKNDDVRVDRVEAWLQAAAADAERRGLSELKPLLDTLAQSTRRLRTAEWNEYVPADGRRLTADGGAAPLGGQKGAR